MGRLPPCYRTGAGRERGNVRDSERGSALRTRGEPCAVARPRGDGIQVKGPIPERFYLNAR